MDCNRHRIIIDYMPSNGFALKNMGHNIAYNMFLCNFASSSLPVVTSLCLCGKGCPAGGEVLTYNNKESVGADATGLAPTVRPQSLFIRNNLWEKYFQ